MSTDERSRHRSPLAEAVEREGMVMTYLLIVEDVDRSVRFYRDVLGGEVLRERQPAMLRLHGGWLLLNVGGGPTDDKPDVTVTPPLNADTVSSFLNIRVADLQSTYELWSKRGASFLTPPTGRGAELRCFLRDPDGHLIEVGQTLPPDPAT
jgi:catechol 2,3-dioxygenase-like lactoylglutathione lyase family enzyme